MTSESVDILNSLFISNDHHLRDDFIVIGYARIPVNDLWISNTSLN